MLQNKQKVQPTFDILKRLHGFVVHKNADGSVTLLSNTLRITVQRLH